MPVIAPVPVLMDRPAGRPVADQLSVWPSASLADGLRDTATPIEPLCAPIDVSTGVALVMLQAKLSLSVPPKPSAILTVVE